MGFLSFLNKGKKKQEEEVSLEIPPPPSIGAGDVSDFSELPGFADDTKGQEVPLPPLGPIDEVDKSPFSRPTPKMEREKFEFPMPPKNEAIEVPLQPITPPKPAFMMLEPKDMLKEEPKFDFSPFKEDAQKPFFASRPELRQETPRIIPAKRQLFVRAEKFAVIVKNADDIKEAAAINKSLGSAMKIRANSDKEFERFHNSLEDMQRNLFYIDSEIFEQR